RDRSTTPGDGPCMIVAAGFICADISVIAGIPSEAKWKDDVTPGRAGQHGGPGSSHLVTSTRGGMRSLHVVVVRILADVADIEDDGLGAEILPPMRGAEHLRPDIAGLVDDRLRAVAGVLDDFALLHKDQRGTVVVAMPRNDAAGLDRQLAEAQLAILDVGGLLLEVDRAKRDIGYADGLVVDLLANVCLYLVGGTFPGDGARCGGERCSQREAEPECA